MSRRPTRKSATSADDDAATAYARAVAAGEIVAGPHVRDACNRHLRDLDEAPGRGFTWDRTEVAKSLEFFADVCRLNGGQFEGRPFVLNGWESFVVGSLFGWKRQDGTRRFRTAYIETGKGPLALDTPIATAAGWSTMGELAVDDIVFDERGEPCRVVGVSEVFHDRPCYRLRFSDGCEIVADAAHEWRTAALRSGGKPGPKSPDAPRKGGYAIRNTREIAATLKIAASASAHPQALWNHRIDVCGPLELPLVELPIEPYALGYWLGNGDSDTARITVGDRDCDEIAGLLAEAGTAVGPRQAGNGRAARYRLGGGVRPADSVQAALRRADLIGNKRIPRDYQRAAAGQRMALLQGLMDADGSALKTGECELTLCRQALAADALELIRSLGYKPGIVESDAKIAGRVVGRRWRIRFHAFAERPPFRLARKAARLRRRPPTRPLSLGRMIVGCDPVASVPVRCITVDSPSHLFLAGDGLIATHNSGKSPLAAGIGLRMLCGDGEKRAEIYAAAVKQDQAKVLFRDAVAMVQQSPALSKRLSLSGGNEPDNIAYFAGLSFFRPISSERQGRGQSGPRPHCALLDEIHEHPTNAIVEFMAAGVKWRRQPLIMMITNSGSDRTSVCWEYHQYGAAVCSGDKHNDEFFAYICALDKGDNPFESEDCWIKVNPSLPEIPGFDYIRSEVLKSRGMPSKETLCRRLNFCEWTEAHDPWITKELWMSVQHELDLSAYEGRECWGGLDLSISSDLTAFVLAFPTDHRRWDIFSWFWMPGGKLAELQDRDGMAPYYAQWRDAGYLHAPDGRSIDYEHAASVIGELASRFDVQAIAYDRHRIEVFRDACDKVGVTLPLIEHGQGFFKATATGLWMPGSIGETEAAITDGRMRVNPNPVLNYCVGAAVCQSSAIQPSDRYFKKSATRARIDGAVALAQAIGAAAKAEAPSRPFMFFLPAAYA